MNGSLDPEERVMESPTVNEQVAFIAQKYGWEEGDEIVVEVGGTVVSGIHQGEDYNKKWATPFGVRKYNKDAFIIISNQSRRDLSKSQPMDREHKPQHPYTPPSLNISEEKKTK
jgi:phosphatidylserine decarboxylase